jgi:hypothetical protein
VPQKLYPAVHALLQRPYQLSLYFLKYRIRL